MIYTAKKHFLIPIILITVLIFFLLNLLIKPNLTIKTLSEVFPKEKWILTRGTNGQLISSMIDYESGHTVQYNLNQFERGEFISLKYFFNPKEKKFFNKGDTIMSIYSSEVEDRLVTIEGELNVAKANLTSQSTGQKEALIKEAESRLNYIDEKIKEQKVLYERSKSLYEKELISQQDYEIQKWIIDLLEIEKKIYKAQLENLSTGVKPEEINLLKSQIAALESRLNFLKKRKNDLTITSPISGSLLNVFSQDTLMTLINDREVILHTPVKISDLEFLKNGSTVNLQINKSYYTGFIVLINKEVKLLNNQQVVFISTKLDNKDGKLLPGMILESLLQIKEISLIEYIQRLLSS